jgi:hypothetical protein
MDDGLTVRTNRGNNLMRHASENYPAPEGWRKSACKTIFNHEKGFLVQNKRRDLDNLILDAHSNPVIT